MLFAMFQRAIKISSCYRSYSHEFTILTGSERSKGINHSTYWCLIEVYYSESDAVLGTFSLSEDTGKQKFAFLRFVGLGTRS